MISRLHRNFILGMNRLNSHALWLTRDVSDSIMEASRIDEHPEFEHPEFEHPEFEHPDYASGAHYAHNVTSA